MQQITKVSISILKVHPRNQEFFDDITGDTYEQFKTSIKEDGIITPLIVAPDMTIVSGHQRYKAAIDLNIRQVPVIIREDLDDDYGERLDSLTLCAFCGNPFVDRHHIVPKHFLGGDCSENIICLCPTHHRMLHFLINITFLMDEDRLSKLDKEKQHIYNERYKYIRQCEPMVYEYFTKVRGEIRSHLIKKLNLQEDKK